MEMDYINVVEELEEKITPNQEAYVPAPSAVENIVKPMRKFKLLVSNAGSFSITSRKGKKDGVFHTIYLNNPGWSKIHIATLIQHGEKIKVWKTRFGIEFDDDLLDLVNLFKIHKSDIE